MDEGAGGSGWEKLGPEERTKLRHQVQYRGRRSEPFEDVGDEMGGEEPIQGFAARSPSR
jgi:hypothetical protein